MFYETLWTGLLNFEVELRRQNQQMRLENRQQLVIGKQEIQACTDPYSLQRAIFLWRREGSFVKGSFAGYLNGGTKVLAVCHHLKFDPT